MIQHKRPRRLRFNQAIRSLIAETTLSVNDLIMPIFINENIKQKEPIYSMPGIYRHTIQSAIEQCQIIGDLGIPACALFPSIPNELKNSKASEALNINGFYYEAISKIKESCPELLIISDVALDPYSSDGHDGLVMGTRIANDETVDILSKMALYQAKAGADIIAPSDMMDARVGAIRKALEEASFNNTLIMSYSSKYVSSLYRPFRDALDSAPKKGDKKTYQMDPANRLEALKEVQLDEEEGADIILIKPASIYTDIIRDVKENTTLPIAAYHVSGEYSMIKAAADKGYLNYEDTLYETLLCIKRAGANMILSYGAIDAALMINQKYMR
ncbi:porphobilinogen synthase [bacterium]|nr:porphobilinogen synthase [bacterium]